MGLLQRKTLVEQLSHKSGRWHVSDQKGDVTWVSNNEEHDRQIIGVRSSDSMDVIRFSANFPMRFNLERSPSGVFARLLLRNAFLRWSSWTLEIAESCEAAAYLHACMPKSVVDATLFDGICQEMRKEIGSFRKELYDKFRYDLGQPPARGPAPADPDIRFVEPAPPALGSVSYQIRARVAGTPKQLPKG